MGPDLRPMVAVPCPVGLMVCSLDAECPGGQVCEVQGNRPGCGMACEPGCPTIACPDDMTCERARCRPLRCDEVGGPSCEEHWRCDPAAAPNEPLENEGSRELDLSNAQHQIDRGCVRIRCGEPGGYTCKDDVGGGWACDPENAIDGSGCVASPCSESGICSDSSFFICEPTSSNPRPAGVDPHGCVPRNCEEGIACLLANSATGMNVGYCDFEGPYVDERGCAIMQCVSDAECDLSQVCEPGSAGVIRTGCRQRRCTEGYTCPSGLRCDPSSATLTRCVPDSGGTAGSGGWAGSGGTAGSGGDATIAGSGGIASPAGAGGSAASGAAGSLGRCTAD
jgi:hypothetical protein